MGESRELIPLKSPPLSLFIVDMLELRSQQCPSSDRGALWGSVTLKPRMG